MILRAQLVIAFIFTVSASCTTDCPEGSNPDSLYCHAGATDSECQPGTTFCDGSCADLGSDPDNCGQCGNACSAGETCSNGSCGTCTGGLASCDGICVDTNASSDHCGGCGIQCTSDEVCSGGSCLDTCQSPLVECGGVCIDPNTDEGFCGARDDCLGANAGEMCGPSDACQGGTCVSQLTYVGSLPATTGRWTYTGVVGIPGANAACSLYVAAGSAVCSELQLRAASNKGELVNATAFTALPPAVDGQGNIEVVPVDEWWIEQTPLNLNPDNPAVRCVDNTRENIPWSYPTGHLLRAGYFAPLTAGILGTLATNTVNDANGFCRAARYVPCCLPQP